MTSSSPLLAGLERLTSETGIDTRETLLRVASDFFLQAASHTASDKKRFADLALPLLKEMSVKGRIAFARKIAPSPHAPQEVIDALLADVPEVAREVANLAPALSGATLKTLLATSAENDLAAMAARRDLDDEAILTLIGKGDVSTIEALAANPHIRFSHKALGALIGWAFGSPARAAEIFRLSTPRHQDIAAPAATASAPEAVRNSDVSTPAARQLQPDPTAVDALKAAIRTNRPEEVPALLAATLGVEEAVAALLLADTSAEPLTLSLVAAGLDRPTIVAALLTIAPANVRRSVPKVFAAAALIDSTNIEEARTFVRQYASGQRSARPRHTPFMDASGTPSRISASSASARRPLGTSLGSGKVSEGGRG